MARRKTPRGTLKQRITGLVHRPARDLQDHRGNWRTHPQYQAEALQGVLEQVGIAGALLVYDSPARGGLTILDGHLRKTLYPDELWPCLLTDLDEAEADTVLLTADALTTQAVADPEDLGALLERVGTAETRVQGLLDRLYETFHLLPEPAEPPVATPAPPATGAETPWPVLQLRLPPAVHAQYQALAAMTQLEAPAAQFARLLDWAQHTWERRHA